eukprot:gene51665-39853_t
MAGEGLTPIERRRARPGNGDLVPAGVSRGCAVRQLEEKLRKDEFKLVDALKEKCAAVATRCVDHERRRRHQ